MKQDPTNPQLLLDEGPNKLNVLLKDAKFESIGGSQPDTKIVTFTGKKRSTSQSGIAATNATGFGIELHARQVGCEQGTQCYLVEMSSVLALEYDQAKPSIRCHLQQGDQEPLEIALDQSSTNLWAACWIDGKKAYLWSSGQPKISSDHEYPVFDSAAYLFLGGSATVGTPSYYGGSLAFLRLWSNVTELASLADSNQD